MVRSTAPSSEARSLAQSTSNGMVANGQGPECNGNPQSDQASLGHRRVTQEQIIVGHFCRFAITTLARLMGNNPRAAEAEAQLKEHIKTVWVQWVRQQIPRRELLLSVASYVRNSDEATAQTDVIFEFKAWYEREYELQQHRTGATDAEDVARQLSDLLI